MNFKRFLLPSIAVVMGLCAFTSCIDENYDLSNVDTTAELKIKDIVLPLNIEDVELAMHEFVSITDTGRIQVINGQYVLIDSGTYASDEIIIPAIKIPSPSVPTIKSTITLIEDNTPSSLKAAMPTFPMRFDIGRQMSAFTYQQGGITDFIVDMDLIGAEFDITIDLKVEGLENHVKSWTLEDFKMQFPKGLTGETNMGIYDPETGVVELGTMKVEGSYIQFKMSITEVDLKKAGAVFNSADHSFTFSDELGIHSGNVVVAMSDIKSFVNIPKTADFSVVFKMGDINVNMFGGTIQYSIDGFEVPDIPITGVPDILSQNTDLRLVNPQIYICFSNPLGTNFGLKARTGLTLTAKREGKPDQYYTTDNEYFELSCKGCQGCQFCLSPIDPGVGNYWGKFVNAQHIPFSSLSYLLSGDGLPTSIGIKLNNPCLPAQKIAHFPVGANLGKMTGCYTIFAPLQLKDGSQIIYSGTEKGWWSEDLENIKIEYLQIDALVTNDLPIDVEITCYPIDRNGNKISDLVIDGVHLKTGVEDYPMQLKISGNIENLDGVTFVATAKATPEEQPLRPDEHLILKNLKVKVSGNYKTKF